VIRLAAASLAAATFTGLAAAQEVTGAGASFPAPLYSKWAADYNKATGVKINYQSVGSGAGGKGNEGVAAFVGRLPNSIGYVEYAYVKQNKMTYALMQNAAGNFVAPEDKSFKAAAAGAEWSKSFYQILTNQPGADSWPITGATFILVHKVQDKPQQAAAVLKFFDWAYKNGDKTADDLDYVPMPPAVKAQIEKLWASEIKDASGKPIAFK
jgi:phosphate transport system substrate-binding protein